MQDNFKWSKFVLFSCGTNLNGLIGPVHLKDEMSFQAELFRPEDENLACPEAETIRPKMTIRPLDVQTQFVCLASMTNLDALNLSFLCVGQIWTI